MKSESKLKNGTNKLPTESEINESLEFRHTKEIQSKLSKAEVAICGLGGLGSNIAIVLARCGIGRLHLIDFDKVDLSNVNRQQYLLSQIGEPKPDALKKELLMINPYLKIDTDFVKINEENVEELLKKEKYICEAFDDPYQKAMLTNHILESMPDKILVGASGMAGYGKSNEIVTRKIMKNYYLCGDGVSEKNETQGLMAPRVMICAAHQANKIIELIVES